MQRLQKTANNGATNQTSDVSFDKLDSSLSVYVAKRWWKILLSLAASILIFFLSALIYAKAFLLGFAPFFIYLYILQSSYEANLFKAFAKLNGYTYSFGGSIDEEQSMLFSIGHDHNITNVVSGTYSDQNFHLFNITYEVGSEKYSHKYNRSVMSVDFKVELPNFVLRRPGLISFLHNTDETLSKSGYTEILNLEGNFQKHFKVDIKPNTQVDVLSLLTPDVMQVLLPLDRYEIEMAKSGEFYIYDKSIITKKKELVDMYKILDAVTVEIGQYAKRQKVLSVNNTATNSVNLSASAARLEGSSPSLPTEQ